MTETSPLGCPKCLAPMSVFRGEDAVLHACGTCRGVWLDNGACQKLMAGMLSSSTQEAVARVDTRPGGAGGSSGADSANPARKLACPACGSPMTFVRTEFSGVCVDVCARHGTWFDSNEIRAIAQAIAIKSAADDAFVEGEMLELRRDRNEAIMNKTPLGRLLNFLR